MLHKHVFHSLQILTKEALKHNLNCIEIVYAHKDDALSFAKLAYLCPACATRVIWLL